MRCDRNVVSTKGWVWRRSGREQDGGKAGNVVRRERSVIGRKLGRSKQDRVGRWGFVIAGCRERGSMRQDTLEDAGPGGIGLGAGLPCKLRQATSGASGRRPLHPLRPDVSFSVQIKRAGTSTLRTGVYLVCACSVRRIGRTGRSRTQVVFFC